MSSITKILIGIVIFMAIVFIIIMQMSPVSNPSTTYVPTPLSSAKPTVTTKPLPPENASASLIKVDDQPATTNILVKEVNMPDKGYVVVQTLSKGNMANRVVGNSQVLTKGIHTTIRLSLYGEGGKPLKVSAGDQFIVMLYKDNGDGKYGRADILLPMKDANGGGISKQFKVF